MVSRKKAQSIVEYLLVFGGIILAVLLGAKMMAQKAEQQFNTSSQTLNRTADYVSQQLDPTRTP